MPRLRIPHCVLAVFLTALAAGAQATDSQGQLPVRHRTVLVPHRATLHHAVAHVHHHAHRLYVEDVRPSYAALHGLRHETDALALQSSVALVMDEGTSGVLFAKHPDVALPIASITKLMTSLVVLEAHQPMDERIEITNDERDYEKGTSSRLAVGTVLPRGDLMHLALMSSENRAAHALCRSYPGGLSACLAAMNAKALAIGMSHTHFNDPTGLSKENVASAEDLAKLVQAASENETIRNFSTDTSYTVPVGRRLVTFHSTNALVAKPGWDIVVQKTGYIVEAGKCLVMKAKIEGKAVLIVLLDSAGKYTRFGDATRIKKWMEAAPRLAIEPPVLAPTPAVPTPIAASVAHTS